MKSISTPSESATTVARQAVSAQYTKPSCVKQRFWYRLLVGRNETSTLSWSIVTVPCFDEVKGVTEKTKAAKDAIIIEMRKVFCDIVFSMERKKIFISQPDTSNMTRYFDSCNTFDTLCPDTLCPLRRSYTRVGG